MLPRRRLLLHALLVAAGWLLFAWSWHRVTAARPEAGQLRVLMLGALAVVPPLTLAWVLHNLGIYRRKGPRRAVPVVLGSYGRDFNGRLIEADWAALAASRFIVVDLDGDAKRYTEGAVAAGEGAVAAGRRACEGGPDAADAT